MIKTSNEINRLETYIRD